MLLMPSTNPSSIAKNPFFKSFSIRFEDYLGGIINDLDASVQDNARYTILNGGKRIRPLLTSICGYPDSHLDDIYKASAIVELVHIATLIHDDILDDADFRRNRLAVHKKIGTHDAVLLGDVLFSYGLELSTEFNDSRICRIVSKATRKTCSGEISQNNSIGNHLVELDFYLQFIQDKTGELFAAACQSGGVLSNCNEDSMDCLGKFGLSLGLNYQLFDDIIDAFGNETSAGKTLGTDFLSRKPTLPVIALLNEATIVDKDLILELLNLDEISDVQFRTFISLLEKYSILDLCLSIFEEKFTCTNTLIRSLGDVVKEELLTDFMSGFITKLNVLDRLKTSNFLALHTR